MENTTYLDAVKHAERILKHLGTKKCVEIADELKKLDHIGDEQKGFIDRVELAKISEMTPECQYQKAVQMGIINAIRMIMNGKYLELREEKHKIAIDGDLTDEKLGMYYVAHALEILKEIWGEKYVL